MWLGKRDWHPSYLSYLFLQWMLSDGHFVEHEYLHMLYLFSKIHLYTSFSDILITIFQLCYFQDPDQSASYCPWVTVGHTLRQAVFLSTQLLEPWRDMLVDPSPELHFQEVLLCEVQLLQLHKEVDFGAAVPKPVKIELLGCSPHTKHPWHFSWTSCVSFITSTLDYFNLKMCHIIPIQLHILMRQDAE